ncbi:hypothetical protein FGK63_12140 [Ruegeria sediminis]|uniref:Uncharacterized protein n=1 Tax=Ruegeria sediminis TaxID=2583820 RepID=A0ABY2WVT4_9RHOB|nr:hypothetical protein FGK63_12140 [Ruegeria sediminis]
MELLRQSGIKQGGKKNKVALFRDVRTADALRAASPAIRRLFLNSGFGLNTYDSGVPAGYYPAEDEEARNQILRQLVGDMKNTRLRGEYCGDFELAGFLDHILTAKPLITPASMQVVEGKTDQAPSARRKALFRVGIGVGLAAIAFALIKCLADTFSD